MQMEKKETIKNGEKMKQKKPYIAPKIRIIPMEHENLMDHPGSYRLYDENGNVIDKGTTVDGIPGQSKESPYSGDWEL